MRNETSRGFPNLTLSLFNPASGDHLLCLSRLRTLKSSYRLSLPLGLLICSYLAHSIYQLHPPFNAQKLYSMNSPYSSFGASSNNKQAVGPRSKCDQVIFEALCKACEVIVGSRATIVGTGSSRFNLQVPEVSTVRSILAQYRQQLHVPIRLDVFYQTNDENTNQIKRDLLERWCLQYTVVSSETFLQEESLLTNDPMIQLTHVCRRIVVWLRTLYCSSRLLPAQLIGSELGDAKKIGFSVYIHNNDESTDDLHMPGFIIQDMTKPVTTPYGSLSWKVSYCKDIEKWIPKRRSVRIVHTPSQPIPMSSTSHQRSHGPNVAASAPTRRELSYTERSQQRHLMQTGKSFDPSVHHQQRRVPPARRNTTQIVLNPLTKQDDTALPEKDEAPERVMSGLSLAMMGAEPNDDIQPEQQVLDETAEARRAALHEAPPHMREQDYGYAYNNQINWQKLQQQQAASPVLRPLAGTPPGGAFLGAATPPSVVRGRSRSDSGGSSAPLTPPFPPRPTGFVTDRAPLRPFLETPDSTPQTMEHPWMPNASTSGLANSVLPSSLLEASSSAIDTDDMPFAISALDGNGEGSALLQLAQKCTATRLKLFEDSSHMTTTVEDLTSQLDSMRAFGESLHEDMADSRTSVRS